MNKHCSFLLALLLPLALLAGPGGAQAQPPAPENLIVTQMTGNARLDWDAVTGALAYRVYKAVDAATFQPIGTVNTTHLMDPFVPPGATYRYYVTALNLDGEGPPSNDVTFVPDLPPAPVPHGFITGTVLDDSTGLPVCGVRVRFYEPTGDMYFREAKTDTSGQYFAPLDTGSFLVYATKWTYIPEWYDDVPEREFASAVTILHRDTATADFGMTRIPPPALHRLVTVSGTVTDTLTGEPVKNAWVVISRTHRQIALMQNYEGNLYGARNETFTIPGLGTMIGVVRAARTDSLGAYSLLVPDSLTYILMAFKPGYVPEFYQDKRTPFDADRVPVLDDTPGIDFDLEPDPLAQNSVAGTVVDGDGYGVKAKVVLFLATDRGPYPVRFTMTDSLGSYAFGNVYTGTYYVKAVPVITFAPAWYDPDSCGTPCWVYADSFHVDGDVTSIDVCVKPILFPGFASIGGTISESPSGDLLQGATVYAFSATTGEVTGYDITESDGSYTIDGIAPGSYTLLVDREGYLETWSTATTDAANNYAVADADIALRSVLTSVEDVDGGVPSSYTLGQNYPNPFNPSTGITFGVPSAGRVSIEVYNTLGQFVTTLVDRSFDPGSYTVHWAATDDAGRSVPSGVYFYRMTAHDPSGMFMVSVRKMLLVR